MSFTSRQARCATSAGGFSGTATGESSGCASGIGSTGAGSVCWPVRPGTRGSTKPRVRRAIVSGLDDLTKRIGGARSGGGVGDLLGGLGGGGLGGVLGGILGGGGAQSGGLTGGNPLLRMLLPLVASLLMNGGLEKILGRLQQH